MTRALVTAWLEQRWYGGVPVGLALRGLATVFGALAALRRTLYAHRLLRVERLDCPVLVVGNLTVGGAGKTPLTEALVRGLRERGWRPGIVSRGVGGSARGAAVLPDDPDPAVFGDEPCLLARRTGAPVAVARRRADAGRLLRDATDVDLLIADDALQHLALARDIEVLVVDARRRFGNGRLLPAGPLRERPERAERCDFQVLNGTLPAPEVGHWTMQLMLDQAIRLDGKGSCSLLSLRGQAVHAVAGIADPTRFFIALAGAGVAATLHPFPDHHPFTPADFDFDDGRPLLMTEKDAVKCRAFARPHWYSVPAEPVLEPAFLDAVHARLLAIRSST